MGELRFRFSERADASSTTSLLARDMWQFPPEKLLKVCCLTLYSPTLLVVDTVLSTSSL
jgi:hypothetical protein